MGNVSDEVLLFLSLTRVTVYKGVEIQLQAFLISALFERKWSNARPGRFIFIWLNMRLGESQSRYERFVNFYFYGARAPSGPEPTHYQSFTITLI
jgi:hypothetical protein